jgi:CRISPR-associated endonuclease Csy4
MDQYIDIRLRPDPEFPAPMLMGALYGKLHRVLVCIEAKNIGVSFPGHSCKPRTLGGLMRLHGSAAALDHLMEQKWLTGMHDHIDLADRTPVPSEAQYRVVRRRQFKTNAERLRRRRAHRHNETREQAREKIPDSVEKKVELPFAMLRSQSTGEAFCLFIEHGELQPEPIEAAFNRYGLSQKATVPWF